MSSKVQHTLAGVGADVATLARHPVYVLNVAATAVYTGAVSCTWNDLHMHEALPMCLFGILNCSQGATA